MDATLEQAKGETKTLQYLPELDLPIYIQFNPKHFTPQLEELLIGMGFAYVESTATSEQEVDPLISMAESDPRTKVLKLKPASPMVARQIQTVGESDQYGVESITHKGHYQVYRYHKVAMIIYSSSFSWWEAGIFKNFGSSSNIEMSRMIINRFLSWTLLPYGFLGLWGQPVDGGGLVMSSRHAKGEALFINIEERELLVPTGGVQMGAEFKIYRSDPIARNHERPISSEELLSFLHFHHTYLDYQGVSVAVRLMLQVISQRVPGHKRDLKMVTKSVPLPDAGT
jgi:hypothetical protein